MPSPKAGKASKKAKEASAEAKTAKTLRKKAASGAGSRARSRSTRTTPGRTSGRGAANAAAIAEMLAGCEPGSLTLLVTEKPSVARDVARALTRQGETFRTRGGFLQGERHLVTWAVGHLLELCEPQDYKPSLKSWRLDDLPILPEKFRLKPLPRTKPQLDVIVTLMRSPACGRVVNACDAGREGELIFRHLLEASDVRDLPIRRLWVSAMTDEAILEGLVGLGEGADFENLEAAARCRSESDWLVGINATRGMTKRCGGGVLLSVGRVQTPTLAILAEREREIAAFVPEKYWEVRGSFTAASGSYCGAWFSADAPDGRLPDVLRAQDIAGRVAGQTGSIGKVDSKRKSHLPQLLYDLTQLQRDMNRRHGFSASRTLSLAQDLYERFKVITYPRTDSRFLHGKNIPLLGATLRAVAEVSGPLGEAVAPVLEAGRLPITGRLVNDARVRDHHAIIPTLKAAAGAKLKGDHAEVFEAVARRFVAAFYPAAVVEDTTVVTLVSGETFRSQGRTIIERGWLAVEEAGWLTGGHGAGGLSRDEDGGAQTGLPQLVEGMAVVATGAEVLEKETRPPSRYTEASLLQMMETAGRLLDEEELQDAMKERGIGTPATRAAIIERLIDVGYLERDRRSLVATPKGLELISAIPTRELVSPVLTGQWEARLRQVERGELPRPTFMADIQDFVQRMVNEVKAMDAEGLAQRMRRVVGKCPRCRLGDIMEGPRSYYCSRGKNNLGRDGHRPGDRLPEGTPPADEDRQRESADGPPCDFYIWKVVAGRPLRPLEVTKLLGEGRTFLLRGFRSRAGRRFSAFLTLTGDGVKFAFPERKSAGKEPARGRGRGTGVRDGAMSPDSSGSDAAATSDEG